MPAWTWESAGWTTALSRPLRVFLRLEFTASYKRLPQAILRGGRSGTSTCHPSELALLPQLRCDVMGSEGGRRRPEAPRYLRVAAQATRFTAFSLSWSRIDMCHAKKSKKAPGIPHWRQSGAARSWSEFPTPFRPIFRARATWNRCERAVVGSMMARATYQEDTDFRRISELQISCRFRSCPSGCRRVTVPASISILFWTQQHIQFLLCRCSQLGTTHSLNGWAELQKLAVRPGCIRRSWPSSFYHCHRSPRLAALIIALRYFSMFVGRCVAPPNR